MRGSNRGGFVGSLRSRYYGDDSPLPIPAYILDRALLAIIGVIAERGREGLSTYWEGVGTFAPWVRAARKWEKSNEILVKVDGRWVYVTEVTVVDMPERKWFYLRGCAASRALESLVTWNMEPEEEDSHPLEDGVYKQGRAAVWGAVAAVLSTVTKGKELGRYFWRERDAGGVARIVASPLLVAGFLRHVAAWMFLCGGLNVRGFGRIEARIAYQKRVHPITNKVVWVGVPGGVVFRMRKVLDLDGSGE